MTERLRIERDGRVAIMTLDRPGQGNAIDRGLRDELRDVIDTLDSDRAVDVLVLTGTDPAFCAGADFDQPDVRSLVEFDFAERAPLGTRRTPLIAAVNGAAIGLGLELALECDVVIASERASFVVGAAVGEGSLMLRLSDAIGARRAREIALTARAIDPTHAERWGLVTEVVEHEQLLARALATAAEIAANDQQVLHAALGAVPPLVQGVYVSAAAPLTSGREPARRAGEPARSREATRSGRGLIDPQQALTAALAMIDEDGIAAFSIEKLARRLGVRGPSLYRHFTDKADLLARVGDLVLREVPNTWDEDAVRDRSLGWSEQAVRMTLGARRVLLEHPNALPIVAERFPAQHGVRRSAARVLAAAEVPEQYHPVIVEGLEKLTLGSAQYWSVLVADGSADDRGEALFVATCIAFLEGMQARIENQAGLPTYPIPTALS